MDKIELLKKVSIFQNMTQEILQVISEQMEKVELKSNEKIFSEGDNADSFYIVESGQVVIFKNLSPHRKKILTILNEGSVLGEMALFQESARIASAYTKTDSILWKVEKEKFFRVIKQFPDIGLEVFSALLRTCMERLEQTSRELATVYEISRIVSSGSDLSAIIAKISDELLVAVPNTEKVAIYVYNEFNMEFENPEYTEISKDDKFISDIKNNDILLNSSESILKLAVPDFLKKAQSLIIVRIPKPLSDEIFGFIILWNETSSNIFNNSHLILVNSVANQLSEAIENIFRRQEEINRLRLNQAKQNI